VNPQWGHQHCEGDARLPTRPRTHIQCMCLPSTHIHICVYPVYVNPWWGHQHCKGDARLPTRPPVPTYMYVSTQYPHTYMCLPSLCESSGGPSTLRGRQKKSLHVHAPTHIYVSTQYTYDSHKSIHPHIYVYIQCIHMCPYSPRDLHSCGGDRRQTSPPTHHNMPKPRKNTCVSTQCVYFKY